MPAACMIHTDEKRVGCLSRDYCARGTSSVQPCDTFANVTAEWARAPKTRIFDFHSTFGSRLVGSPARLRFTPRLQRFIAWRPQRRGRQLDSCSGLAAAAAHALTALPTADVRADCGRLPR